MTTHEPRSLKSWESEHASRLVDAINLLRERYGWTIPRLRNELELFGWSPSLETLNGILSARKRKAFSVGEVFAFARALRVSPSYLMVGLPSASDLPTGPVTPEPDVASVYAWVTDSELQILGGSAVGPLAKYSEAIAMSRWHNALWVVSGQRRVGADLLTGDLRHLVGHRSSWREYQSSGFNVPELPELPPELEAIGLDDWDVSGPLPQPLAEPLPESFSGPRWIAEAREYIARLDARKAEVEEMEQRGGLHGAASDAS